MKFQKGIRYFVIVLSLVIFCYQMTVAFNNLRSDATVDSTEYISISDLDSPPVITFCPRQEAKWENPIEGYRRTPHILKGKLETTSRLFLIRDRNITLNEFY